MLKKVLLLKFFNSEVIWLCTEVGGRRLRQAPGSALVLPARPPWLVGLPWAGLESPQRHQGRRRGCGIRGQGGFWRAGESKRSYLGTFYFLFMCKVFQMCMVWKKKHLKNSQVNDTKDKTKTTKTCNWSPKSRSVKSSKCLLIFNILCDKKILE